MARNRYGWEKRAKELARQAKRAEKIKRRQSKSRTEADDKTPESQSDDQEPAAGD